MPDELEPRVKVAINEYLFKWLAAIGIANAIAILTGFAYIFFVLPKKATTEAVVLVKSEIQNLRDQLISASGQALGAAGKAQGLAEATAASAIAAQGRLDKLRTEIAIIEKDEVLQVSEVIKTLRDDPKLAVALDMSNRVVGLEASVRLKPARINCPPPRYNYDKAPASFSHGDLYSCTVTIPGDGFLYLSLQGIVRTNLAGSHCVFSIFVDGKDINTASRQLASYTNTATWHPGFMSDTLEVKKGTAVIGLRSDGANCSIHDPDINGLFMPT